ncbi:MAG: glycoside hydrolase family 3 C-terminal domain-containing protein [Acidimicrobiales bacterium]|nr:glycoside hydrolase family 3 C-terminal domain-containing protein [Acidimicrobiales bacterium]
MTMFDDAAARVAAGGDHRAEAAAIVAAMTLDEKLDCLDGDTDFWPGLMDMVAGGYHRHTWPAARVERLGVPGIAFSDGPRGCVVGRATAFPVSMARGATFDPELEERIGDAIGAELRAAGATYTGAVCLNLLRHPGWGRAQETYGEDPHHVGEMAAALTRGLQRHVMACMKHFACNSMENARFKVDVTADERALHEVYLPHFKRVADEGVASVMSAYNSLNGEFCGENRTLLVDILRDEWGWDGFVTSDFIMGLRTPAQSVTAGLDIEMPFRQQRWMHLRAALDDGSLTEADVDARVTDTVATLLRFAYVYATEPDRSVTLSDEHRALARDAASRAMVLLCNDGTLPLDRGALGTVAVLGRLADTPNTGDKGSSQVIAPDVVTPLAGLRAALDGVEVRASVDDAQIAAGADVAIVVVGLTAADEGEFIDPSGQAELGHLFPPMDGPVDPPAPPEDDDPLLRRDEATFGAGGDRRSLALHAEDEALIAAARAVCDQVVVVVMGGSAVLLPWIDDVAAVLHIWYPGMEGGHALADVLLGTVEPGGRLPFVIPTDEAHLPHWDPDAAAETYDLFHGQWLLDRAGHAPLRPFGFGLGYTTWALTTEHPDGAGPHEAISCTVTNTGDRAGSTVVQVYAGLPSSAHARPQRRLVGFRRVTLEAGASTTVAIPYDLMTLAVRDGGGFVLEPGDYRLTVGFDALDEASVHTVTVA